MANQFGSTNSLNGAFALLKNWYAGPIVSQFNDEIPFYREIEKGKEKYNGSQVVRPVKVLRNNGIGAVADGGTLPAIGQQTTVQAQIAAKFNYLRFGITGPLIKASQGDKGSFVDGITYEMTEGLLDLKSDVNRQLGWNGNGTLATVQANTVASTSLVVTGRTSVEDAIKFLQPNMVIDIVSGGVVTNSAITINSISGTTTCTLTLSAPVTCLANDVVIRSGSLNNEVQGILTSQDGGTSTIFNVNRSTYYAFQGNLFNANSSQLTLAAMQQAYNSARRRGGAKINAIFCDYDSERYYNKLLVADKRYIGKVPGDGTFTMKDQSYLEFGGVPIAPDKDFPQYFMFLDTRYYKKYVLSELEWADETGTYLIAQTSSDSFEARLRLFFNLFPEKPAASAALYNFISP